MVDYLQFHDLMFLGLLCLGMICSWLWLRCLAVTDPAHRQPVKRSTRRSQDPKPFPGLTKQPTWVACEQAPAHGAPPPDVPPPLMVATRGRPCEVNTQQQYCPNPHCSYGGWVGLGNIRANGHPSGGRWRQLQCLKCLRVFSGDARHAVAWQTRASRAARARGGHVGRRLGSARRGADL